MERGTDTDGGLVQHEVDAALHPGARVEVGDVAFDEVEALEVFEVLPPAGREVVDAAHGVAFVEQHPGDVRADEAGDAGDRAGLKSASGFDDLVPAALYRARGVARVDDELG